MNNRLRNYFVKLHVRMRSEEGQDLIEYALVVVLIAFAATAGMNGVAGKLNSAFNSIGSRLTTYTS